jgi:FkbM family methyltransferase
MRLKGVVIDVNGCMFRPIDSESVLILQPEFEEWMWSYLRVPKGGVFIDVGAHIGKYTIPMAKAIGDSGLVIAVEPHPDNYKQLVENIRLKNVRNVIALNIAAWSEERWMKLFIGDVHGHHSLVYDFGRGFTLVRARPLDNVLEELGIKRVDCVKVVVEGAELEVLKGLRRTLKRFKPIVVAEIRNEYLSEVEDLSRKLGYVMKQIAPMYYVLEPMQ